MTPDDAFEFDMQYTSKADSITHDELNYVLAFIPEILKEMNRQSETDNQD